MGSCHAPETVSGEEATRIAADKQLIDRQLKAATELQRSLVPRGALVSGRRTVAGHLASAFDVGGDFFDYFRIAGSRFGLAVADVSGKGISAALLGASAQAYLRAYCDGARPLGEAIATTNRALVRAVGSGKFVTLFYGELDDRAESLAYVNAGHNYPLLRRGDGSIKELVSGGSPLGPFEDAAFDERRVRFGPEDALLLFSDG